MTILNSEEYINGIKSLLNDNSGKPLNIKSFYHYISNLKYIVFLDNEEDVYWFFDGEEPNERIYALAFTSFELLDKWRSSEVKYDVLDFKNFMLLLDNVYTKNNTNVFSNIVYDWNEETNFGETFRLDIDSIKKYQRYVLFNNAMASSVYICGAPSDTHDDFIDLLTDKFKKEPLIKEASFFQIVTPPQKDKTTIESHKPNTAYFSIVYDTFGDDVNQWLSIEKKYQDLAKEFEFDLLMVHKSSEIGGLPNESQLTNFYFAED